MISHFFFFFKQKTAYEIRKGDWSSDVCSSDLRGNEAPAGVPYTACDVESSASGHGCGVGAGGCGYLRRSRKLAQLAPWPAGCGLEAYGFQAGCKDFSGK